MFYKIKLRIYFSAILLLLFSKINGQIRCKVEHYSTEDGFSHNVITSIIKDREGFMWFSTRDGINRDDGHSVIIFKAYPGDKSDLKDNWIDNIIEDKSGLFWLKAHNDKIYIFDKKTEKFKSLAHLLNEPKITAITFDKIIPSSEGAVWLTTVNRGLFFVPKPNSSHSKYTRYADGLASSFQLPSNNINFLHEDKEHRVWVGTPKGLSIFEKDKAGVYKKVVVHSDLSQNLDFTCIAEDNKTIWLGTGQGYLLRYQKVSKQVDIKKIANSSLNAICISKKSDVVYASTSDSRIVSINKSYLNSLPFEMPGAGPFLSVYEDGSGLIWIEPEKYGIIKFNPYDHRFKYFSQTKQGYFDNSARNYKVFEDNSGIVWMSMKGGGFGYYTPATDCVNYFFDKPGSDNYKFSNMVSCSYFDPAGVLWLCSDPDGVNKIIFQRNDFNQTLLIKNGYKKSDNEIKGIYNDSKNRLWLGTKSGELYVCQDGKKIDNLFVNEPKGGLGMVYCILQDTKGTIWLGTKGNGLFRATPTDVTETKYRLSRYQSDKHNINSLSNNDVYSIFEDKKGRIWIGTFGGGLDMAVFKNQQIQFINEKNSFINYPKGAFNKIRDLNEDAKGNLWIATTDGLLIFNPDGSNLKNCRFVSFSKTPGDNESLGNNDVQFIYKDSKNTMWAATSGGGLNKVIGNDPFKSLKFESFTTRNGLPNDYIKSVIEDNNGNLWLTTENGLSKFNISKKEFKNYNSYDGLPKINFSESSSLKLPNGDLVFGTINGYIFFNPDKIINHQINAPVVLTHLQINNKEVVPAEDNPFLKTSVSNIDKLVLKGDNTISISFTVLDYRSSNKPTYVYRLRGFDKSWVNNGNQRKASYTNLSPGNYVFEVKTTNDDLYTNQPYKSLTITILPPLWRTWWAYLIYFILSVILIEAIRRIVSTMLKLRNKISVERRLSDLKLTFLTNISHELRTPLTLILNPIEAISKHEKLSAEGREYINTVRKSADRMVRFINQLLDLRKVQNNKAILKISRIEILSFVEKIRSLFAEIATEKQITVSITSNVNELFAWIDAEKIDIVIYNLLANAFKFTPHNTIINIEINAADKDDLFIIKVIDQGIGVPDDQLRNIFELYYEVDRGEGNYLKGTGIGLALSKELVELHHGKIFAENNLKGGLSVTLELHSRTDHLKSEEFVLVTNPEISKSELEFAPETEYSTPFYKNLRDDSNDPLILLVEDNNELRKFLSIQLRENYRIEVAKDGEEGLLKAMELIPDLVLSDVMMPKMDGIQMLDKLKNTLITSHIPVLLLTAKSSIESQIEGLKYGADDYITKPFENAHLLASIQNLLKQRQKVFESLLKNKKPLMLSPEEIVITSKDEVFLKKVIKIVESGMTDTGFNIDTVAASIGMGRTTFYRKFKSLTNLAPVEFVRKMRLKRGKQLLDAGEDNISVIAYKVGFHNAKYFSTCFKEEYHLSPTEYLRDNNLKVFTMREDV